MSAFVNRIETVLPNAPVTNDQMETVLGQAGPNPSRARKLVLRNNGIKTRYYALDPATRLPTHNNAQLTAEAVRKLAADGFSLDDIDLLATGTSSPDQLLPNHAVMVHGELGSRPCETISSSGVCVSGVSALKYAQLAVSAGEARNAVVTASELSSTFMWSRNFEVESEALVAAMQKKPSIAFEKDFLRWMLSDGAAALLVQPKPNAKGLSLRIDGIDTLSFANLYPPCMYAGAEVDEGGKLRGWRELASTKQLAERSVFAVKQDTRLLDVGIPDAFVRAYRVMMDKRNLHVDDIDWFLPHYSSDYFRKVLLRVMPEGMQIPEERWFTNLERVGNVGSASIFLMLEELFRSEKLAAGQRLLCFIPESGRFSIAFLHLTVVEGEE